MQCGQKKKWLRFVLFWKGVLRSYSYDCFLTSQSPTFLKFLSWERGGLLFPICHISFFLSPAMPSWETKVSPFPPRKYPGAESLKFICWVTPRGDKVFWKILSEDHLLACKPLSFCIFQFWCQKPNTTFVFSCHIPSIGKSQSFTQLHPSPGRQRPWTDQGKVISLRMYRKNVP